MGTSTTGGAALAIRARISTLILLAWTTGCGVALQSPPNTVSLGFGDGEEWVSVPDSVFGTTVVSGPRGRAFDVGFSRRLYLDDGLDIRAELPVVAAYGMRPYADVTDLPERYSMFAVLPAVRVGANRRVSVSMAAGPGWVRFVESEKLQDGTLNTSRRRHDRFIGHLDVDLGFQIAPRASAHIGVRMLFSDARLSPSPHDVPYARVAGTYQLQWHF